MNLPLVSNRATAADQVIPVDTRSTRLVLGAMMLLQVLWLGSAWLTGATTDGIKLLGLLLYTLAAGLTIVFLPSKAVQQLRRLGNRLVADEKLVVVTLVGISLFAGLIYAHYQRIWPYDEENSYEISQMIAQQGLGPFFAQYAQLDWLGPRHPPLLPLINGFILYVFGVNLFIIRLFSLALGIGTILVTYYLGRELYDRQTGLLAALFLLSFPLVLRLSTAAMADAPVMFFSAAAILLVVKLIRTPSLSLALTAGVGIGLGLLTKYEMALIFVVLFGYFLLIPPVRRRTLQLIVVGVVSVAMVTVWLVYAYRIGVFQQQAALITRYAGLATQTGFGKSLLLETLVTRLPSALGTYNLPLFLMGAVYLVQRRAWQDLSILIWIAGISLPLLLTLPDHRYFMPMFPAAAILAARGLKRIPGSAEQVALLSLLLGGGALYLFVDWARDAELFLH